MRLWIAAAFLAVTACAGSSEPDVDWSKYPPVVKDRIDKAADEQRCEALIRLAFEQTAAAFSEEGDDPQLSAYIDAKIHEAGCVLEK